MPQSSQVQHNQTHSPQQNTRHNLSDEYIPEGISSEQAVNSLQQVKTADNRPLQRRAAIGLGSIIGNRALQRVLMGNIQRDGLEEFGLGETAAPTMDDAMPADMAAFLARGVMPGPDGLNVTPTGIGGFNARFDPNSRELQIALNVGIIFPNGLQIDPTTNVVTVDGAGLDTGDQSEQRTITQLQNGANKIMTDVPAADRAAIVNSQWRWSGEQDSWMQSYAQSVKDAWGAKHFFVSQDWSQLFSSVRVAANVHAGRQDGDHCKAKIVKTPPGGIGAFVQSGSRTRTDDQELIMSSSALGPRHDNLLQWQLYFAHDSSDVASATSQPNGAGLDGPTFLKQFINTFNAAPGNAGQPIRLVGRASSVGAANYNQQLSERRSAAVEQFLQANGLTGSVNRTQDSGEGETGTDDNADASRRVDLIIGSGAAQNVAMHESGHLLGLDDEYSTIDTQNNTLPADQRGFISGTGNAIGATIDHTDIDADGLADAPIDGAVAENNDNIMSLGDTVRPQHYATFHSALEQATGKSWRYGGEGDPPTHIPGTPTPDGGVIV
ncbi:MAG: OmpA family protein [Anaerolineae bacterium]|nr:OmpA family protein [Anaerolineae bacterium]